MKMNMEWLPDLLKHLTERLAEKPCDSTINRTVAFLNGRDDCKDIDSVVELLIHHCVVCDCETLRNVRPDESGGMRVQDPPFRHGDDAQKNVEAQG